MEIKLIAADLDDTLVPGGSIRAPIETTKTLELAAEKGIALVPATGRMLAAVPQELLKLPGVRYVIYSNGATVWDLKEEKAVYEDQIPLKDALKALEIIREYDLFPELSADGEFVVEREKLERLEDYYVPRHHLECFQRGRVIVVEDLGRWAKKRGRGLEKINIPKIEGAERQELMERLSRLGGFRVLSSLANNLEINASEADKGRALRALASLLALPLSQVMALGDNENDVGMLRTAGLGVAMGNAVVSAREAADCVAPPCSEEGAVAAIRKWALGLAE